MPQRSSGAGGTVRACAHAVVSVTSAACHCCCLRSVLACSKVEWRARRSSIWWNMSVTSNTLSRYSWYLRYLASRARASVFWACSPATVWSYMQSPPSADLHQMP